MMAFSWNHAINKSAMIKIIDRLLYIIAIILLGSPFVSQSQTNKSIIKRVENISTSDAERVIGLKLSQNEYKEFSGYYHYYRDKSKKEVLNGSYELQFLSESKETNEDPAFINKIVVKGNYVNGKLVGNVEKYSLYDDGVDIFYEYTVILNFDSIYHQCAYTSFDGKIGFIMPRSKYEEQYPRVTSFQYIIDVAWDKWGKEFDANPGKYR
jgi:hypothetical protein